MSRIGQLSVAVTYPLRLFDVIYRTYTVMKVMIWTITSASNFSILLDFGKYSFKILH